ncbi:putative ubiquitin-protein ligase [Phaeomoniella chlamydospora]|uniref:Putative ubiquitin-protein ligase n=1 Tax=Phaeomoniella chlamydospora TaxID=158046 RepID=A0A0G2EY32_PHACM|nr:putative ubiquitin-protein ligase [Phaeomoniella chlamydospora]
MGLSIFGTPRPGSKAANTTAENVKDAAIESGTSSLPFVLDKVNVPVEVLLIALISCCNSFASNVIAVLNKQNKWRLINTAIWGTCFMIAFVWGFFNSITNHADIASGFLRFPTVCIVGFIPHLLILVGMSFCAAIYCLALTLTAFSLETNPAIRRPTTFRERWQIAHENLQAAIQVKGFEIRWYEDFYTALLRIGFAVLSAASEAVFLNEGRAVEVRRYTWLEEERFDELESAQGKQQPAATYFHIHEEFGIPPGGIASFESGYGIERKIEDSKAKNNRNDVHLHPGPNGVGALQRSTRFWLLFVFVKGIFFLVMGWAAYGIGSALDYVGLTYRPRWLRTLIGKSLRRDADQEDRNRKFREHAYALEHWIQGEGGELRTPRNEAYDIEPEIRRRLTYERSTEDPKFEKKVDQKIYDWWKSGGWFGSEDFSGEYRPTTVDDEDTTSVISMSTNASTTDATTTDDEREWEELSSGQITPTQADFTRESTPVIESDLTPLDASTLSRLLNPRDTTSRSEARILSSHLSAPEHHIITRSQFRRELERERSGILLAGRVPNAGSTFSSATSSHIKPSAEQESEILENMILTRRQQQQRQSRHSHNSPTIHDSSDTLATPQGPLTPSHQYSEYIQV